MFVSKTRFCSNPEFDVRDCLLLTFLGDGVRQKVCSVCNKNLNDNEHVPVFQLLNFSTDSQKSDTKV